MCPQTWPQLQGHVNARYRPWLHRKKAETPVLIQDSGLYRTALQLEMVVDFAPAENRHLQAVRVWAESIAIARQSRPLSWHFTDRKEVSVIVIAQAKVLQAPLIHPAQISQRQVRVCYGFAHVERDFRGDVGLAVGRFE